MAPPAHIPIIQESQKDRALGLLPSAVGRIGQEAGLSPQVRTVDFRTPGRNMPNDDAAAAGRWAGSAEQDRWAGSAGQGRAVSGLLPRGGRDRPWQEYCRDDGGQEGEKGDGQDQLETGQFDTTQDAHVY